MKKRQSILIGISVALSIAGIAIAASQISDTFTSTSKISQSYQLNVDTTAGQVKLAAWNCGDSFTDYRDGTAYTTVLVGSQCWMAKNLNYGTRVNGSGNQTNNSTVEKYCYSDSDANCTTYGGLYQWDEAMDYGSSCNGTGEGSEACSTPVQGICPESWHIPSHYEYVQLERTVCTSGTCASDFPYDTSTTGNRGTNEGTSLKQNGASGFEGLLAGFCVTGGSFFALGFNGFFWSSLESGTSAWFRALESGYATVGRSTGSKANGFSIRCIKD
jgi:uncharacterized protein (TIGR02145 family)